MTKVALAVSLGLAGAAIALIACIQIASANALRARAQPVTVRMLEATVQDAEPRVRFRYSVNAVEHDSTRVAALVWRGSAHDAETLVDRCQAGGGCMGFFDPKNPANAFLDLRGFPLRYHAALLAAVIVLTAAVVTVPLGSVRFAAGAVLFYAGAASTLFHYLVACDAPDVFLAVASVITAIGGIPLLLRWRA